jgi:hypothetical protein
MYKICVQFLTDENITAVTKTHVQRYLHAYYIIIRLSASCSQRGEALEGREPVRVRRGAGELEVLPAPSHSDTSYNSMRQTVTSHILLILI